VFAFCLIDGDSDAPQERAFAWIAGAVAVVLGTLHAYSVWRIDYAGLPAESYDVAFKEASYVITALTTVAFIVAFVRAAAQRSAPHRLDRRRLRVRRGRPARIGRALPRPHPAVA